MTKNCTYIIKEEEKLSGMAQYDTEEIFTRSRRLLGDETMQRLQETRVIVFGIGGVGSWAAEALVRTGLQHITLVDADRVAVSNINRQAPATTLTVGEEKTMAMRRHLLEVNPQAEINIITNVYSADTTASFNLEDYDYIIDAIDSLADKALLINNATRAKRPRLFSSMGAALKLDPSRIAVAEFWKVDGCRLAAALRRRFKKSGIMPARKFKCVYSPELLENRGKELTSDTAMSFNKVAVNGSLCHITAIFGMTLAGLVIESIVKATD